jgi:tetratricopeptide (TPR) repeat protein
MLGVGNLLLGVALFDICHDVQYLAIVWLINCRRADAKADLGWFMQYIFRRGMVLLYLGLITAYGAIAFTGQLVLDGTVQRIFFGILFTSTILHYYYDGFIWKVREMTNQAGLGLDQSGTNRRGKEIRIKEFSHFLKCAPALLVLGLLFTTDLLEPSLTTKQKDGLENFYTNSLMGKSRLPSGEAEQSWLYGLFERVQNIAAAVPEDRSAQLKAAIMLANFGRNDEAVQRLEKLNSQHPNFCNAQLALGSVYQYLGKTQLASEYFQKALASATTADQRSAANLNLGNIFLQQRNTPAADARFKAALQDDPSLETTVKEFRQRAQYP